MVIFWLLNSLYSIVDWVLGVFPIADTSALVTGLENGNQALGWFLMMNNYLPIQEMIDWMGVYLVILGAIWVYKLGITSVNIVRGSGA